MLVVVDRHTDGIWAFEVDGKGIDIGAGVKWLTECLNVAGYSGVKVTIRSDQEPAILVLKNALALERKAETSCIEGPVRESKCNGLVERVSRNWRDQCRTLRHFLGKKKSRASYQKIVRSARGCSRGPLMSSTSSGYSHVDAQHLS